MTCETRSDTVRTLYGHYAVAFEITCYVPIASWGPLSRLYVCHPGTQAGSISRTSHLDSLRTDRLFFSKTYPHPAKLNLSFGPRTFPPIPPHSMLKMVSRDSLYFFGDRPPWGRSRFNIEFGGKGGRKLRLVSQGVES